MKKIFDLLLYFIKRLIDRLFNIASTPRYLISTGIFLALPTGVTWAITANIPVDNHVLKVVFSLGETSSPYLFFLGIALIFIGVFFEIWAHFREIDRENKRRIFVIELRGLRDVTGTPLTKAVPRNIKGVRETVLISLPCNNDGNILDPSKALQDVELTIKQLKQREAEYNRSEVVRIFGGLAPVPYLFLAGLILDDEQDLKIMDWNRETKNWQQLDQLDDSNRFMSTGLDKIPEGSKEVILSVSASHQVNIVGAKRTVGDLPIIDLELEGRSSSSHWSENKQMELTREFFETVREISDKGIEKIHLFLAAPASLSFRFGTCFDKRNFPETVIYQYKRGEETPFPWGISLPVAGKEAAEIEFSS
jgi:hypothetical protein